MFLTGLVGSDAAAVLAFSLSAVVSSLPLLSSSNSISKTVLAPAALSLSVCSASEGSSRAICTLAVTCAITCFISRCDTVEVAPERCTRLRGKSGMADRPILF